MPNSASSLLFCPIVIVSNTSLYFLVVPPPPLMLELVVCRVWYTNRVSSEMLSVREGVELNAKSQELCLPAFAHK